MLYVGNAQPLDNEMLFQSRNDAGISSVWDGFPTLQFCRAQLAGMSMTETATLVGGATRGYLRDFGSAVCLENEQYIGVAKLGWANYLSRTLVVTLDVAAR